MSSNPFSSSVGLFTPEPSWIGLCQHGHCLHGIEMSTTCWTSLDGHNFVWAKKIKSTARKSLKASFICLRCYCCWRQSQSIESGSTFPPSESRAAKYKTKHCYRRWRAKFRRTITLHTFNCLPIFQASSHKGNFKKCLTTSMPGGSTDNSEGTKSYSTEGYTWTMFPRRPPDSFAALLFFEALQQMASRQCVRVGVISVAFGQKMSINTLL